MPTALMLKVPGKLELPILTQINPFSEPLEKQLPLKLLKLGQQHILRVKSERKISNAWLLTSELSDKVQLTAGHTGLRVPPLKSVLILVETQLNQRFVWLTTEGISCGNNSEGAALTGPVDCKIQNRTACNTSKLARLNIGSDSSSICIPTLTWEPRSKTL